MSAKIAWHSPRTLRYASNHLKRGKYFKVTSYTTVEFRIIINIMLSIKEWVALHFKIATYCEIQKISNFGDKGLGNFRDKG